MSVSLSVKREGRDESVIIAPLTEAEIIATVKAWKAQCRDHPGEVPGRASKAAYEWNWVGINQLPTFQVYGLRVPGIETLAGMVAVNFDGESVSGYPCLAIYFVCKMPVAFNVAPLGNVGTCLVLRIVELSKELGLGGRVFIKQAWRRNPLSPREDAVGLYRSLYFKSVRIVSDDAEYEDMENTAEDAERLIREHTNGG